MSNMSYCRFANTSSDLTDCFVALQEMSYGEEGPLSERETNKAEELIETCLEILEFIANEAGVEVTEIDANRFAAVKLALKNLNQYAQAHKEEES